LSLRSKSKERGGEERERKRSERRRERKSEMDPRSLGFEVRHVLR